MIKLTDEFARYQIDISFLKGFTDNLEKAQQLLCENEYVRLLLPINFYYTIKSGDESFEGRTSNGRAVFTNKRFLHISENKLFDALYDDIEIRTYELYTQDLLLEITSEKFELKYENDFKTVDTLMKRIMEISGKDF